MIRSAPNQRGFHVLEVVIIVVILFVLGLIAWRIISDSSKSPTKTTSSSQGGDGTTDTLIKWTWNGEAWAANGVAPDCPEPLVFSQPPTDMSRVTGVLYPGQTRGGNYKPHGGFRLDGGGNDVTVKAIMDGYLTSGARYIEKGELQYLFTITNSCGIAYRYDHLATLSPLLQTIADSLPPAKENDSRTTNFDNPLHIKAGDTIATTVGFKNPTNVSFDLGVYDYRKRNVAANSAAYLSQHKNELSQAAYALCWLDMFPGTNLRNLPAGDPAAGKSSDYCD